MQARPAWLKVDRLLLAERIRQRMTEHHPVDSTWERNSEILSSCVGGYGPSLGQIVSGSDDCDQEPKLAL